MSRSPLTDPRPGDVLRLPAGHYDCGEGDVTVTRVRRDRVWFHRDGLAGMVALPRWQREMAGAEVVRVAGEPT